MALLFGFLGSVVEVALLITFLHKLLLGLLRVFRPEIPRMRAVGRLLGWMGFFWVQHRTGLTVFRNGKFIRLLSAPDGHLWHHIWPHLQGDRIGPDIELAPSFVPQVYENLPASLTPGLLEQMSGGRHLPLPPRMGRPVNVTVKLIVGYHFKPQNGTYIDAVEKAIYRSTAERNQMVCNLLRPELERITARLNPIDIRLRFADDFITAELKERTAPRLIGLGYELLSVEIDSITLPDSFETMFVANQELLRQSLIDYSPDDLARMLAAQLGHGLRSGAEAVTTTNLDSVLGRSLRLSPPRPEPGKRRHQG